MKHLIRTRAAALLLGASLSLLSACSNLETGETDTPPAALLEAARATYADDPAVFNILDQAVADAGTNPARLADLEEDFVQLLEDPQTTPAGRQAIAQRLGHILGAHGASADSAAVKRLARLLRDEETVEIARLALEPVPGEAIDQLFLDALDKTSGRARVAVMQAIGARLISQAVPQIAALLDDPDPATASMAIHVLGQIDGADALAALEHAPDAHTGAVLDARLAAASRAAPEIAGDAYERILRDPAIALEKRAMALRGILDARPESAVGQIHEALLSDEPVFHEVALEAIRDLPNPETSAELVARLDKYTPEIQLLVVNALGHRGDGSAVPGLIEKLDTADEPLSLAILQALAILPADVAVARKIAALATGSGPVADAAADTLARLNGDGIDEWVRQQAAEGDLDTRIRFIDQIARRNLTEAIPFLLGLTGEPELKLRLAALDALRVIAGPAQRESLIAWALSATERAERTRAVRALIAATLRDDDVDTRAAPILAAITEGDAETQLALMPVLSRVAGAPAIATATSLALGDNANVALAAVGELARWPDAAALEPLVKIAEQAADDAVATRALESALRMIEQGRAKARAFQCGLVSRLLELDAATAIKNRLLIQLRRCADEAAIALAEGYLGNPETEEQARLAIEAIRANLAWPPALAASTAPEQLPAIADGDRGTLWRASRLAGEWISADLHVSRPIARIILDQGRAPWNYPQRLKIYISETPQKPAEPVTEIDGTMNQTIAELPAGTHGRYLWLETSAERENGDWLLAELIIE